MRLKPLMVWMLVAGFVGVPCAQAMVKPGAFYDEGVQLYQAGRYGDAIDAFDSAVKHKDHAPDAQGYIDRIRKETVDRIRNRALTGVNKANWQTKYYFMNVIGARIHVGISQQEIFERNSTNFRPGALDALSHLADGVNQADNVKVDIDFINELNQDTAVDPAMTAQQLTAVFSYLSLSARGQISKY